MEGSSLLCESPLLAGVGRDLTLPCSGTGLGRRSDRPLDPWSCSSSWTILLHFSSITLSARQHSTALEKKAVSWLKEKEEKCLRLLRYTYIKGILEFPYNQEKHVQTKCPLRRPEKRHKRINFTYLSWKFMLAHLSNLFLWKCPLVDI